MAEEDTNSVSSTSTEESTPQATETTSKSSEVPQVDPQNPYGKPTSCIGCPLCTSKSNIVWGKGKSNAKILLVGEAPGEEEDITREPFFGGSGRVLNRMLAQSGIIRSETFVTNAVKCRPTAILNGRTVNRAPTEAEIRHCARYLMQEIRSINPNLILATGNIPLKLLTTSKKGITYARSVPLEGPKRDDGLAERYKVIGTYHPAYIMRQQDLWPLGIFDLVRARNESATPVISRRSWKRVIHARLSDVGESLERRIREPRLGGLRYYFHDLETTGLNPRRDTFRCIGIAAEPDEVYVFDWTPDVVEFTRKIHADETLLTVGQNSEAFDIWFQEEKGIEFNGPTYDTLIGWHMLNASLPKDLGTIGATVTDEPYWKDNSMYKAGEDALQHGCGKDVHATGHAFVEQYREMELLGQLPLYFNHIMPLQPVLRRMTRRGVKKDNKRAIAWTLVLGRKADELEARLKRGLGDPLLNVNSPKQLIDLLYRRMGLPIQYKQDREKGFRPSVDADALDALASSPLVPTKLRPILLLIRWIRTLRKWSETFINCEMDENFFVHGHFSSAKAANGRLNSYDPNMQNFPVDTRDIIIPDDEDSVLIARDWSQIEWRIAMALAGDQVGLDALAAGRDPHSDAYANAFDVPYDTVDKKDRFEAKTYNYGLLYGRGAASLAAGRAGHPESAIPVERVEDYINRFYGKYQAYKKSRDVIESQVKNQHYVETAWGRRRYWYTTGKMPEAFNFPISGSAAHMMYHVLPQLERELPKHATLRLTIHDEVVVHSPKDQKTLRESIECMKDVMEQVFPQITERSLYPDVVRHYYPNGWSCPSDTHIGENWKITKGETEPDRIIERELRKTLGVEDMFDE